MSADPPEAGSILDGFPDGLREWIISHADTTDVTPEQLVSSVVATYREVQEGDMVDELEHDGVDAETFERALDDVRRRVIQVKQETDQKAPADHTHDDLEQRIESLERRLEGGFDNFETILKSFDSRDKRLDDRLTDLASIVVAQRNRLEEARASLARAHARDRLKRAAATHGSRRAKCDACGHTVDVSLLAEAACPACGEPAADIEPRGLLRTNRLVTGERPALPEGDEAPIDGIPDPVINDDIGEITESAPNEEYGDTPASDEPVTDANPGDQLNDPEEDPSDEGTAEMAASRALGKIDTDSDNSHDK